MSRESSTKRSRHTTVQKAEEVIFKMPPTPWHVSLFGAAWKLTAVVILGLFALEGGVYWADTQLEISAKSLEAQLQVAQMRYGNAGAERVASAEKVEELPPSPFRSTVPFIPRDQQSVQVDPAPDQEPGRTRVYSTPPSDRTFVHPDDGRQPLEYSPHSGYGISPWPRPGEQTDDFQPPTSGFSDPAPGRVTIPDQWEPEPSDPGPSRIPEASPLLPNDFRPPKATPNEPRRLGPNDANGSRPQRPISLPRGREFLADS